MSARLMSAYYYARLPGMPAKLKWPVKLCDSEDSGTKLVKPTEDCVHVYCRSDNAIFDVKLSQLEDFPSDKNFNTAKDELQQECSKTKKRKVESVSDNDFSCREENSDHAKPDSDNDFSCKEENSDHAKTFDSDHDFSCREENSDHAKPDSDNDFLLLPNLIRTTSMRRYMATMIQSLDTTETQRQWIVDHMGHNMDIHMTYYRQSSDILERVEISKLLLIQDFNRTQEFAGKTLSDIDLTDIVSEDTVTIDDEQQKAVGSSEPDVIPDLYAFEEEEERQLGGETQHRNPKKKAVARQKWSAEEEKELKILFSDNFLRDKCPDTKQINRAVKQSIIQRGSINKRPIDNIKNKTAFNKRLCPLWKPCP